VEIDVDDFTIPHGALPSKSLTHFLEEAISNAVRHGQGRGMKISIAKLNSEYLHVTVIDNGLGLQGKPSVLSQRLHEITTGTVKIQDHENGGAMLQATFKLADV
jgi:signal transduction histidine kinase